VWWVRLGVQLGGSVGGAGRGAGAPAVRGRMLAREALTAPAVWR